MATHSSVLAWRIPGMVEPDGLLSMGAHRVGHDWSDLAVAVAWLHRSYEFEENAVEVMCVYRLIISNRTWYHHDLSPVVSTLATWLRRYLPGLSIIRLDQSLSRVRLSATPWIVARQASLSITSSRSSLRLMSIKSVMPSSHFILCRPLLLLPPVPPSIKVFSNESALHMRWPKYWSFNFSIIPSKEIPGLISFRMDWLDLLAVQGTLSRQKYKNVYLFILYYA